MKPIKGSGSPPEAKEVSVGKYRVIEIIGYRCTSCNTTFNLVVAQTPVERVVDLQAATQLEGLEKELEDTERGIRGAMVSYLKIMRLARRVDRQQITVTGGIGRPASRAWTRLSARCPNCNGRYLNKIKYSDVGVHTIEKTQEH